MKKPTEQDNLNTKRYKYETKTTEKIIAEEISSQNPIFIANLIYSIKEERDRTNGLLATLLRKIESLEKKIEKMEKGISVKEKEKVLGDIDNSLIEFIQKKGKVNAKEVQKEFNYKGTNAASSRLHKLYKEGILEKKQAGRNVYYLMR